MAGEECGEKTDVFQILPGGVLGRVWPADRVLLGTRVCKWMNQELASHVPDVVLAGSRCVEGQEGKICWEKFEHCESTAFRWRRGNEKSLNRVLAEMARTLDEEVDQHSVGEDGGGESRRVGGGGEEAGWLCRSLREISISKIALGREAVGSLVSILRNCKQLSSLSLPGVTSALRRIHVT